MCKKLDSSVHPFVSIVMPVLNEEVYLERSLASVFLNDYPSDRFEVLVYDGGSLDNSCAIVRRMMASHSSLKLLRNEKRIQASALNLGIAQARGEYIIRMDGHTIYAPDYIRSCIEELERTGAENVGGVQRAVGESFFGSAVAAVLSTPLGVGDAKFRYSQEEEWVDTVYLGAWRTDTLKTLGGFKEWPVNEDYELNYRIRTSGGRILLSPKIICHYFVRSSLLGLIKQYFRYGFWKAKMIKVHPTSIKWRQLLPPCMVLGVSMSLATIPFSRWGWFLPLIYLGFIGFSSLYVGYKKNRIPFVFVCPAIFVGMHWSWGLGFLMGLFCFSLKEWTLSRVGGRRSCRGCQKV